MHKCQYGKKGLGKNDEGIIEPVPNKDQNIVRKLILDLMIPHLAHPHH